MRSRERSPNPHNSGCELISFTSRDGGSKPSLTNGKRNSAKVFEKVKKKDESVINEKILRTTSNARISQKENANFSKRRLRQRPHDTQATNKQTKYDRFPLAGHVSSIIRRFGQTKPTRNSSVSSFAGKSSNDAPTMRETDLRRTAMTHAMREIDLHDY